MKEPNIHYYSVGHRDRVMKMNDKYLAELQIIRSREITERCLGVAVFILLVLAEVLIIGSFA